MLQCVMFVHFSFLAVTYPCILHNSFMTEVFGSFPCIGQLQRAAAENDTQPVEVMDQEIPDEPPAVAHSPDLDASERRLKYQKVSPKDSETQQLEPPTEPTAPITADAIENPDELPAEEKEREEVSEVLQGELK